MWNLRMSSRSGSAGWGRVSIASVLDADAGELASRLATNLMKNARRALNETPSTRRAST